MSAHVLLNLLSELRKSYQMLGCICWHFIDFFNKSDNSIIQEHTC